MSLERHINKTWRPMVNWQTGEFIEPVLPNNDLATTGILAMQMRFTKTFTLFEADFLFDQLCKSAIREGARHDFGSDIVPASIETDRAFVFEFRDQKTSKPGCWRDVGMLDSYYEANMELLANESELDRIGFDRDADLTHGATVTKKRKIGPLRADTLRIASSIVCFTIAPG